MVAEEEGQQHQLSPLEESTEAAHHQDYSWPAIRFDVPPQRAHHYHKQFRTDQKPNNFLKGVKWSPDRTCLVSSSEDNTLRVFALPDYGGDDGTNASSSDVDQVTGIKSAIAFSPAHTGMLATGSYSQTTAIYREDNMELLYVLHGQLGGITHVLFSKDGNYLCTEGRKMRHKLGTIEWMSKLAATPGRQLPPDRSQEKEHGDTIVKKAFNNWNDVREFKSETFSGSMQTKSSTSFPSHIFEGPTENITPFQRNLAPPFCVAPVGLEAPLASAISNAEVLSPGRNGATALALPVKLQNTNFGNAMKLSVDESVRLAAHRSVSTGPLNDLIPQGDNGITSAGLPIQSHDTYLHYAMHSHVIHSSSQMDYTANENAAAISSFQSSSTLGNHVMEDLHPLVSDDLEILLASFSQSPPHDDSFFKTPLYDGGSARGTSKGVHGWIKLKAAMKWGIFIRKIATTRRVGIVQLDELPIEVQA